MKPIIAIIGGLAVILVATLMLQKATPAPLGSGVNFNTFSGSATNSSVSVSAATSTAVLSTNSGRVYAAIINDSANTIYCALGSAAIANKGIRLNASGGSYELTTENLFVGQVNCIATSATSTVTTVEK